MFNAKSQNVVHLPAFDDKQTPSSSSVFDLANAFGIEELHFKNDPATGLKAIVAIHSTCRGPALGGSRCMSYANEYEAINDVVQLARGMSYKSAFADLPFGGGKAVLIRPHQIEDINAYFESYGKFIDTLNGRFITAVDVGTTVADMDKISHQTRYVLSTSSSNGDPSKYTAKGVFYGIKAAVNAHLKRKSLQGLRVAIQGVGKVGFQLAQYLHQEGAILTITDSNQKALQYCASLFSAQSVSTEQIFSVNCDVLSPCALGGSINEVTLNQLKARIICGAANNQLASNQIGDMLYQKEIFFVPDYVVNVGGLIHVVMESESSAHKKVSQIYDAVIDIYKRSMKSQQPSHRIADRIAEQILSDSSKISQSCY